MIEYTKNTLENLKAIREAMSKIKEIDRTEYFNQYLKEVEDSIEKVSAYLLNDLMSRMPKIKSLTGPIPCGIKTLSDRKKL